MPDNMSDHELYERARKHVHMKWGFFSHLSVYVVVNAVIIIIWAVTGSPFPWFIFPLAGWGIGLLFHGLGVFVFSGNSGWEQREIEKEVERLKRQPPTR